VANRSPVVGGHWQTSSRVEVRCEEDSFEADVKTTKSNETSWNESESKMLGPIGKAPAQKQSWHSPPSDGQAGSGDCESWQQQDSQAPTAGLSAVTSVLPASQQRPPSAGQPNTVAIIKMRSDA
jgi:hypothetical protein